MASETHIQELIHRLEEGGWAKWIRLAALVVAVAYLSYAWLFKENGFKGLSHPHAFEQAEIAREIARGHGFSTKIIRPAELWLYKQNLGAFPLERTPDTYHAPLWPAVLAPFLLLVKEHWEMTIRDVQYSSDRVVASVALGFFLLAVLVQYFVALRLFDGRMAIFGVALMLICDQFWRFSMSGLPQMLMLFLFSGATYALVRLVQVQEAQRAWDRAREAEERAAGPGEEDLDSPQLQELLGLAPDEHPSRITPYWWAAAAGLCFGLMALAHGLTVWIFAGALTFSLLYFQGRRLAVAGVMLAIFICCYGPWIARNVKVCGSPVGVSWYSGLYQVRGTESSIMRSKEPPLTGVTPTVFARKMQAQLLWQMGNLPLLLGYSMLAPIFFLSLLHRFKRPHTGAFRWCLLLMWGFAVLGMIIFGMDDLATKANDLHVLFIPAMSFYGMAYVLVLWSRLEVNVRILRFGFLTLLFVLSGVPFIFTVAYLHLGQVQSLVEWPPYVPPYIAHLNTWTTEQEIIMSDMPWAVAWYADRKSLWLPMEVKDFQELNDYNLLKGRIVGLYLTPVSGNRAFLSDIMKGEFKEWSPFILRNANLRNFPLKAVTVLPLDNECVFYADRDRWTLRED